MEIHVSALTSLADHCERGVEGPGGCSETQGPHIACPKLPVLKATARARYDILLHRLVLFELVATVVQICHDILMWLELELIQTVGYINECPKLPTILSENRHRGSNGF